MAVNPPEKRAIMVRNMRNIWHRLEMSEQDVQTLRGAVAALVAGRRGRNAGKGLAAATTGRDSESPLQPLAGEGGTTKS